MTKYSNETVTLILKSAWQNTLQEIDVNEDDHFFLLGGDSFLASILIQSLTESFKIHLSLGDLYENPTLKMFSQFVRRQLQ